MAKGAYIGVGGVARKIKKMYIGVGSEQRTLPTGYTQVQYLESTGTQYIDTGFNPSDNSRVLITVSDVSKASYLFGARDPYTDAIKQGFGVYATSATTIRSDYFTGTVTETVDSMIGKETVDKNGNVMKAYGKTITNTTVSSRTVPYPLYLMALNNKGTAAVFSSIKVYSCQIYDNGILIRDFVPCKNTSGTGGMYDLVNSKFYTNAGTGTFTVGSTNLSVARRIKKAYIGVGGVARPCFGGGELEYYGAITGLSEGRGQLAATNIGKYALFAGGSTSSSSNNPTAVDAYDASLVHSTAPTGLSVGRYMMAATSVGEYAIFGGGYVNKTNVDAYNNSLTYTSCTAFTKGVCELAATTVGNYALFGGGRFVATEDTTQSYVYSYNGSLTRGLPTSLSKARGELAAASVGGYAIFAGGYVGYGSSAGKYSTVDTYSASLTKSTASSLSTATRNPCATTVGNYAVFAGGASGSTTATTKVVNAYNASLTRSTPTSLSVARYQLAATSNGDYAIFGGGSKTFQVSTSRSVAVDIYDTSLVHTIGTSLSQSRASSAAATIGDYALFGGGWTASATSAKVDAYLYERPEITVNISVMKTVGNTIYASQTQAVPIKAKVGMKYSDLPFADTNTFEIPDSNGNTLTILLHKGYPAYKITTSAGKSLTIYAGGGGAYVSTVLTDGMTIAFGDGFVMDDFDYSDWTFA